MRLLLKVLNKIYAYFYVAIRNYIRRKKSTKYRIIKDKDNVFVKLCQVKPETWDKAYYPPLYGHSKEKFMEILTPAQYAIMIPNGIINANSDIVITEEGAYWDKYNEEEFMTFANPSDANLAGYTNDLVYVLPAKRQERINGRILSLIGVFSYHWCHYFLQFAAKLYYAGENALLTEPITVLVHGNADSNIKQLVSDYLIDFSNAHVMYADPEVDYLCDNIICIPTGFPNFNVGKFRLDYPYINTAYSIERIMKYAVKPYVDKLSSVPAKYEKIFLTRKKSNNSRNLNNYDEIHEYFLSLGFVDIEGADMSLYEKADIFYHAKEIVAPHGSSLQNLMFCNGAKCLVFTNYRFVDDMCVYTQVRDNISCWMNVAGQDDCWGYHSNYTVPLEKVKRAYRDLVNG